MAGTLPGSAHSLNRQTYQPGQVGADMRQGPGTHIITAQFERAQTAGGEQRVLGCAYMDAYGMRERARHRQGATVETCLETRKQLVQRSRHIFGESEWETCVRKIKRPCGAVTWLKVQHSVEVYPVGWRT